MAAEKQSFTLEDCDVYFRGNLVGGVQALSVSMSQDNKPIHEAGNKKPREIMDGQITYSGSVEQLYLDVDTIKQLVDLETGNNPYFDIVGKTKNKTPKRTIVVRDAKFKGFSLSLGLTDETKITREFDALDVKEE